MKNLRIIIAVVLAVVGSRTGSASAQTPSTLHSFTSVPDGDTPFARLARGSDGSFYGTTEFGGTNICTDGPCFTFGTVFKIGTDGTENVLYRFDGNKGANPVAGLVRGIDSNFYGTAEYGGFYGSGTVFRITSAGSLTTKHVFGGHAGDGANPVAGLVQGPDGTFFGTTQNGGTYNFGTVFAMDPGGTLTTVHHFSGVGDDGQTPLSGLTALVASDQTNLFGTTYSGGSNGLGTVFQIVYRPLPFSSIYSTLYSFTGDADGAHPRGDLVYGNDGNLYGTTLTGGTNGCGTVFQINTNGTFYPLWQFCSYTNNLDGAYPYAGLTKGSDGNFYGTTYYGGLYGSGVAFEIGTNGVLTPLYQFCSLANCADGAFPVAGLVQGLDDKFYGTTQAGGTSLNCVGGCGTVFALTAPGLAPVNQVSGLNVTTMTNGMHFVTVTIPSILKAQYLLQTLASLDVNGGSLNWVDVGNPVPGVGGPIGLMHTEDAMATRMFYRVQIMP